MAREIQLYAVSVATWRESVRHAGIVLGPGKGLEGALSGAVVKQLTRDQTPEACPDTSKFLDALGQSCICIESPDELNDIDGVPFADSEAKRAVATFLGLGRSLSGAALDPHAIYGFVKHGAELDALLDLVRSKAWTAYTAPFRFRAKEIPVFEAQREMLAGWLESLRASGRDVFFASQAFWLPKTNVAHAAPLEGGPKRPAAKKGAKVSSTKATPKTTTTAKSASKKSVRPKRPAAKAK